MKYALYLVYVFNAGTEAALPIEWTLAADMTLQQCQALALEVESAYAMMGEYAHLGCAEETRK